MPRRHFDPAPEALPRLLPIFPLPGALLLPGGKLPLNVFEPRYLAMIDDALRTHRMIGMITPLPDEVREEKAPHRPVADTYVIGCAGRLVGFNETDDGRYVVSLAGLSRFRVVEEVASTRGYRQVATDWTGFEADLEAYPEDAPSILDRDRLIVLLKQFFHNHNMSAEWDAFREATEETLITVLSMSCPFSVPEKQALLEAATLAKRAETLMTMLEFAVADPGGDEQARH